MNVAEDDTNDILYPDAADDTPLDPVLTFIGELGAEDDAGTSWVDGLNKQLAKDVRAMADAAGLNPGVLESWYIEQSPYLFTYLRNYTLSGAHLGQPGLNEYEARTGDAGNRDVSSTMDFMQRYNLALQWLAGRDPVVGGAYQKWLQDTGGGGGSPGITAASFDVDQLTNAASDLWRGYLLEDAPDARSIAQGYVDARVGNPGQALDFETYVLKFVKSTGRYQSIYKGKPEGLSEQQYMAPYLSTAMQYVNPQTAQQIALSGAQWTASPGSFAQRLGRDRDVQNTPNFMNKLEQTMSNASRVLVG